MLLEQFNFLKSKLSESILMFDLELKLDHNAETIEVMDIAEADTANSMNVDEEEVIMVAEEDDRLTSKSKPKKQRRKRSSRISSKYRPISKAPILWKFLLELLTDPARTELIQWTGVGNEFKVLKPASVARLWGELKNRPKMSYGKLARALRYYYLNGVLRKVKAKQFVYTFGFDLRQVLGFEGSELKAIITDNQPKTR